MGDSRAPRPSKARGLWARWLRFAVVTAFVALAGFGTANVAFSTVFGQRSVNAFIPPSTTFSSTTDRQPSSDISIVASGPTSSNPGQDYTIQLTVKNNGPDDAPSVFVRDTLPAGVTFVSSSPVSCTPDGATVYCNGFALGNGAVTIVSLTVRAPDAPGDYTSRGVVSTSGSDANPDNNSSDQTTTVAARNEVALALDKWDGSDTHTYNVGDTVIFHLSVMNSGADDSQGATITDPLPQGMTWAGSESRCSYNPDAGSNGIVTCQVGTLSAEGSTRDFAFAASADQPGSITNQATITPGPNDDESDTTDNNRDSVTITVVAPNHVNLGISVNGQPDPAYVGDDITYTLTASNAGPDTAAAGWTITDRLPKGVSLLDGGVGEGCNAQNVDGEEFVTCSGGPLVAGGEAMFFVKVHFDDTTGLDEQGFLDNSATIEPQEGDTEDDWSDNEDTFSGKLATVDLSVTKSAPESVTQGETFRYTFTAQNNGPKSVDDAVIRDRLPPQVTIRTAGLDERCRYQNGEGERQLTCRTGVLNADGEPVRITVHVTADQVASEVANTATISTSYGEDGNLDNNEDTVYTDIEARPTPVDLAVQVIDAPDPVTVGDDVIYTVRTTNQAEESEARGASVHADVPAGAAYDAAQSSEECRPEYGSGDAVVAVNCPLPDLSSGDDPYVTTIAFTTKQVGQLRNLVTVGAAAGDEDTNESNNSATVTTDVEPAYRITLAPSTTKRTLGESVTLTATVTASGAPAEGVVVTFTVVDGPNAGRTGTSVTGTSGNGKARFTYRSATSGQDTVRASVVDKRGNTQTSPPSLVNWDAPTTTTTTTTTTTPTTTTTTPTTTTPTTTTQPATTTSSQPPASATADVVVRLSPPAYGRVGKPLTFQAVVTNNGPDTATGVVLRTLVPDGVKLESASTSKGNGCVLGVAAVCTVGTLASGDSATVTIVFSSTTSRSVAITTSALSDNDPNPANNTSSGATDVVDPSTPPPAPPASSSPNTYNAVGTGVVIVNGVVHPADALFVLNAGDIVDVTNGVISFTGFDGSHGSFSSTEFLDDNLLGSPSGLPARFRVDVIGNLTVLTLVGGDFSACKTPRSLFANQKPIQQLWGSAKGNFRTKGRYASATIRGTIWAVVDRCDGTLAIDRKDPVDVLDIPLKRTVNLQPGQQYLALATGGAFTPPTLKQSLADIKRRGLFWNGRLYTTRASFVQYLNANGTTLVAWAKVYPARAAAFAKHKGYK